MEQQTQIKNLSNQVYLLEVENEATNYYLSFITQKLTHAQNENRSFKKRNDRLKALLVLIVLSFVVGFVLSYFL